MDVYKQWNLGLTYFPLRFRRWVKGSDTSAYVLLYMLDRGESEVTGSAAVCAADCVADLVYYAAEGERLWDL